MTDQQAAPKQVRLEEQRIEWINPKNNVTKVTNALPASIKQAEKNGWKRKGQQQVQGSDKK